jgi:hypothetical protein
MEWRTRRTCFVGVRGMQELPGQLVVDSGCGGYFGSGRAGIFVGAALLLGGIGVGITSLKSYLRD